jgi:histidinol dehydrogenase
MKQNVSSSQFVNEIVGDGYSDISYEGANALFEYLEELEDSTGEELEFDSVAIRCEWAEYENLDAVLSDYDNIKTLEELQDNTTVILIEDSDRLIIQQF